MSNRAKIRKRAEQLKGRPVYVTLHDGRTYVGWITGLDKDGLTLSKPRKNKNKNKKSKKHSSSRSRKANVSGLMPLFGSLFGMGGGAAGAAESASSGASGFGGIMGFVGMIQRTMPVVKMGYNMIKSISPFLNGLKGLMG